MNPLFAVLLLLVVCSFSTVLGFQALSFKPTTSKLNMIGPSKLPDDAAARARSKLGLPPLEKKAAPAPAPKAKQIFGKPSTPVPAETPKPSGGLFNMFGGGKAETKGATPITAASKSKPGLKATVKVVSKPPPGGKVTIKVSSTSILPSHLLLT